MRFREKRGYSGPSRHPQAGQGGGDRGPGEPNEEVSLRPWQWENPPEGEGVVALKALAYFPWPESFSPEVRDFFEKAVREVRRWVNHEDVFGGGMGR